MATGAHIGDENGIAQKVVKMYVGDENGIAQKVVKAYIGDENGIAQLCFAGAGVKVQIFDAESVCYCVINGVTYNDGNAQLEVEIGTPIQICFPDFNQNLHGTTFVCVARNMNKGVYCDEFQHIACKDTDVLFDNQENIYATGYRKAIITGNNLDCFAMKAGSSLATKVKKGFICRGGMTWRQFADSMFNNGHFAIGETDRVYFLPTNTIVTDPDADGAYVSADAKIIHNKTYE